MPRVSFVRRIASIAVALWLLGWLAAPAQEQKPNAATVRFFETKVRPLLAEHCFRCHSDRAKELKAEMQLDSRAGMLRGGERGPALAPGNPSKSLIIKAVGYEDPDLKMPPKRKLEAEQIAALTRWVKMGAPWPGGGKATVPKTPSDPKQITEADRAYWAYRPLRPPRVPSVKQVDWVTNPIDAFILAKLDAGGLKPNPPATRHELIRRGTYDLIGLPPTPKQVRDFVDDPSPDAYEKLINRLLSSPHYGEKWGRHWLDLVRFAETNGYERDSPKPFAWRYRDYVINSFNKDKPYDRFVIEQIAGDELDEVTRETLIATGYQRLGIWNDEPADRKLEKYDVLDGILSTTAQVMLGMTIGCARCHDHKRDPILQEDYYRMLAFFENVTDVSRDPTRTLRTPEESKTHEAATREKDGKVKRALERFKKAQEELERFEARNRGTPEPDDIGLPPDSREKGLIWSYTFSKPSDNWIQSNFEDADWKKGPGGFGRPETPGTAVRTIWDSDQIWLRRRFTLRRLPEHFFLNIHHDEHVEVYLNGTQILKRPDYLVRYVAIELEAKVRKDFRPGINLIAVHCRNTGGGQYVDVGFVSSQEAARIKQQNNLEAAYDRRRVELDRARRIVVPDYGFRILAVDERGRAPTHIFQRGNPHLVGRQVQPGFPRVLGAPPPKIPKHPENASSDRRRTLAEWIAGGENNPLTARVMVNRLWQFHFGRGIVPTPSDFGKFGLSPTHPRLLDWLAVELMERGWRLKAMHKLIMMSSAYRMSSKDNSAAMAKDPGNDRFWRFNMRRLTAEEIRDSILAVNGTLNLKMGGPSIYTLIPDEVKHTASEPNKAWGSSPLAERTRRSIYIFVKRSLIEPVLGSFDLADTDSSTAVRFATTVPTQALTMLNSAFISRQAKRFAWRLQEEAGEETVARVRLALWLVLQRPPEPVQVEEGLALIRELREQDGLNDVQALKCFCLMAMNLNEFWYLD